MSTVTGVVANVIKNVFSRVRNTGSDMSSRSAAGELFHTVGPLTAKYAHYGHPTDCYSEHVGWQ